MAGPVRNAEAADSETGDTRPDVAQGTSDVDTMLTRDLRRALSESPSLRDATRGIQIVSEVGRVTLLGSVRSAQVRKAVGDLAVRVAGAGNVDNQLDVGSGAQAKGP
jgi:osmotically-inducible protein OsmY